MPLSVARRFGAVVVLLCLSSPLLAQQGFLIPAGSIDRLDSIDQALYHRAHGSGVWLSGDHGLRRQLEAAGIPFEHFPEAGQVRVYHHRFDPLNLRLEQVAAPRNSDGQGLGLVQFHAPLRGADIEGLRQAGLEPLQYYPNQAYLVWGSQQALAAAAGRAEVRFAGDFPAGVRLAPELMRKQGLIQNVNVHFVNAGQVDDLLARLDALGATVLDAWRAQPDGRIWDAKIEIDASLVEALSRIPEVIAAEFLSPEVFTDDEMSSQIVAGNFSGAGVPFTGYMNWLNGIGVTGSGVIWSVIDTGVAYSHPDVGPRIVGGRNYPGVSPANPGDDVAGGGHGTHVAGIIAGDASGEFADANGFLYGLGVAPAAGIYTQNALMGNSWPPAGGWPILTKHALEGNAIGVNNSWHTGEGAGMGYRAPERTHDLMVLDGNFDSSIHEPINIVFSAGNSGPGATTLTAPKEGKNLVVTGSTANYRTGNIDTISGFSSRGPAVDGRYGVTVAAPGAQVSSSRNPLGGSCSTAIGGTNNLYAFCSGTSMAAPQVSGFMALMAEWWRGMHAGADFSPAMGKALAINSARDISGNGPNFNSGFGRIDASTLFDSDLMFAFWDQDELLTDTGEVWERTVGVADPNQPVKITLVWSDAPGAVGANPALVNDLDLVVINDGETFLGNVTSGSYSTPGGNPDRLNNIEQVWIENPGGSATIRVEAFQLAGSAILHNPPGPTAQHFALVCQNCLESPSFTLDAEPRVLGVCVPEQREVAISIGNVLGFDEPVSLALANLPDNVIADFSVNPVVPVGESLLSLDFSDQMETGLYSVMLEAESGDLARSLSLSLGVFNQSPSTPGLSFPGNNTGNHPTNLTLNWSESDQVFAYRVEVATDVDFDDVIIDVTTAETSLEISGLDTSTFYYWRVTAENSCGSAPGSVRRFGTLSSTGDCAMMATSESLYFQNFDSASMPSGWSTAGSTGGGGWTVSTERVFSGSHAMFAPNVGVVSDQRLTTPPIELPADPADGMLLTFQTWQHLESRPAGGCWDGGLLEISTDAGASWSQVNTPQLLVRDYDGLIQTGYSNPLATRQGWCGDPRDWERYAVDLADWAGETVQFRFRLGTDNTINRPGWAIDELEVKTCHIQLEDLRFEDRFEGN